MTSEQPRNQTDDQHAQPGPEQPAGESAEHPAPESAESTSEAAAEQPASAGGSTGEAAAEPVDETVRLKEQLAERTADLQRVQAEFLNYKRRVAREHETVRLTATANALEAIIPVLDDIDRARDHGELEGGFKAVAESLERAVATLGLERFGKAGEEFDPRVHEAISHDYADDVDTVSVQTVLQVGYRVGERLIRPARVAVVEPKPVDAPPTPQESAAEDDGSKESASEGETSDESAEPKSGESQQRDAAEE